ncbi:hypothetical protein [Piscirickettsia salmonis]|uniref:Uncharacterized protein n=2 Tax=Piscirickettsia salmonis TaxID=1238 RepID=A0A9Q6LJV0_PISSA|nr:hypothetical protein [Piscirickettsia salmonis]ALA24322.1 pentapeptide repeats family protein [Piscirickettsia salmonis]QGN76689.1 hypothetical protein Psal001_00879 [Piscirickettsia salmonis]QGN80279.1 hypothetical protein Psal002_00904 [Piscirickettsia salmonis]QGN85449.1 hypothetical protein Psal003_02528 [Piscirickettsia salmonis]QGN88955.1 hypothetical protein Psal004_02520 [Piscirickettsia salmonis]
MIKKSIILFILVFSSLFSIKNFSYNGRSVTIRNDTPLPLTVEFINPQCMYGTGWSTEARSINPHSAITMHEEPKNSGWTCFFSTKHYTLKAYVSTAPYLYTSMYVEFVANDATSCVHNVQFIPGSLDNHFAIANPDGPTPVSGYRENNPGAVFYIKHVQET